MKIVWLIVSVLVGSSVLAQQKNYNVTAYGAKADSKTDNRLAIQKAIDAAAKAGRGKVVVPAGYYVTGPLQLKSGVELHLAKGATLLGSTNRVDYGPQNRALIWADSQRNISITGKGTIDGRGGDLVKNMFKLLHAGAWKDTLWRVKRPHESNRPEVIKLFDCEKVTVKGITVKNSAGWVQTYLRCNDVVIDSIIVNSTAYWNNDGIDIVNCHRVTISHCDVDAADDAITLKSEFVPGTCEDVTVTDCVLRSSANGFKLGTGSHGGFRNIKARNLTVYNTYRSAVAIEAVDGGFLENIDVQNVTGAYTGNAIFIRLGHRNKTDVYSTVKNIYIANVKVDVPAGKPDIGYPIEGPLKNFPHNVFPASIVGLPGHPVQNVVLENIEIRYAGGASKAVAYVNTDTLDRVPENAAGYPEFSMFGEVPAWGFYLRHAENITFKNVKLLLEGTDFRPALVTDDVSGLTLDRVSIPQSPLPAIIYHKTGEVKTNQLQLPTGADAILKR